MKVKIEIDCTPVEARAFLGLPDVRGLQETMMAEVEKKITQSMSMMDPETLMREWLPLGMQGVEAFQKLMWNAARSALDPRGKPDQT